MNLHDSHIRWRCHFCPERAVVVDQVATPAVTVRLDGTVERWSRWLSRFLCAAHQHLDPWAVA